jgi:hypothetical protein
MQLSETLTSLDTTVFPDPDELAMMNLWAIANGFANYAEYTVSRISQDESQARAWLKVQYDGATPSIGISTMLSVVRNDLYLPETESQGETP